MTQDILTESDFEEESLINTVNFESDIMTDTHKKQLETQLWNIANTLRGKMNADEFRDYILGFIFYKYLSEQMHLYANKILKEDGIKYEEIDENTDEGKEYLEAIKEESVLQLGYFLKPSELFHAIAKRGNGNGKKKFILDDLANILNNIEQSTMGTDSEDDFDKLFEDLDLTSTKLGRTESAKNELISKVLSHLDEIDFQLEKTELDVLGDAYEYLIAQFASGAGKKAGEFYTPQEVSRVLAKLVTTGKTKLKSVYDPTCGSGSLLLRVAKEVKEVSAFYGQELNRTTYNLARMNMILHGVHYRKFDIRQEDTLERPQHIDERFEAIVANPPFSADWSSNPLHMSDDRFSQYGKLAPKNYADYAFIQHMVYQLADNGQMAIVLPHGALYRGSSEGHIRKYLIEDRNFVDAVIGLPANLFYGTDKATCILVLKKCRENPNDILFVDASKHFEKGSKNSLRESDIEKIITTYKERTNIDRYSYVASLEEVKNNTYNLNIPKYVKTVEEGEEIILENVLTNLEDLNEQHEENDKELLDLCQTLDLPFPTGNNLYYLERYKQCILQKLFNQEVRFKKNDGSSYDNWEAEKLSFFLKERKLRNRENKYDEVFSVAKEKGVINQIEHLGRSYASSNISNYKVVLPHDVVYTKSPTAGFPFGIIKQNKLNRAGVVSVLYAVYEPINPSIGLLIDYYFSSWVNTYNYLKPLVRIGAKNTMNIGNKEFLSGENLSLPKSEEEQEKIAQLFSVIGKKINLLSEKI